MTLAERIKDFAGDLRDEGIPALVVYMDDTGWHLAAPGHHWKDFAAGLRALADQCDRMADGQRLN